VPVHGLHLQFTVYGLRFSVYGLRFMVDGSTVHGLGFFQGIRFEVYGFRSGI
jgi:hypothetical protein